MRTRQSLLLRALMLCITMSLTACSATETQTTTTPGASRTTSSGSTTPSTVANGQIGMTPGKYIGIGNGRNGAIVVEVTLGKDRIDDIQVISANETHNTGSVPLAVLPSLIVKHQSLAVDMISGATISSAAFLTAVRAALTQAGADPARFKAEIPKAATPANAETDVLVIGAGGAGMTAAIYAAKAGRKVVLLEKLDIVGGTSNYSIEGFGAVGDKTHLALGSDITPEALSKTLTTNNPKGLAKVFDIFASNNGAAADWLRSIGAPMTVAAGQAGVATSRETGELGVTIISALKAECAKLGVETRTGNKATELIMKDGAAAGAKVSTKAGDYSISAKAVVIATGGFAANNELVAKYYPALKGYDSSSSMGATGDGQLMAERAGGVLNNMDYIRVNFTYTTAANGYFYYMGSLFNTGAIFVNNEGKRFVNDQGAYGVGLKVVEQGGKGWAVFDHSIVDGIADVRKYNELGLFIQGDTIEELAGLMGVNQETLKQTIDKYKGYVANGKDEEFNRGMLNMTFDEAPFYACPMTCRVQGTFGGINVDEAAQVLTADGTPIPGLFAAGECANDGTWGANPASVNIVFGRIAGENAAAFVK